MLSAVLPTDCGQFPSPHSPLPLAVQLVAHLDSHIHRSSQTTLHNPVAAAAAAYPSRLLKQFTPVKLGSQTATQRGRESVHQGQQQGCG